MGPLFVVLPQPIVHDLPDFAQPAENIEVQHLMTKGPVEWTGPKNTGRSWEVTPLCWSLRK